MSEAAMTTGKRRKKTGRRIKGIGRLFYDYILDWKPTGPA